MSDHTQPCQMVTGALGFVGAQLADSLLRQGHAVIGVGKHPSSGDLPPRVGPFRRDASGDQPDRGSFGYSSAAGTMRYVPLNLEDPSPIAAAVAHSCPAVIYHLAAQSSAAISFREPSQTFASNLIGTLNLLEAVRALPEDRRPTILAVGSCEEYGPQPADAFPLGEGTPLNPVSPYGVSKAAQTLLCRQYVHSYGIRVIMARSFSHTGPGHDPRFAFPSFAQQIAAAESGAGPAEIQTGDLSARRDFLDVRDVITAYEGLAAHGRAGEIYNVSSGQSLTIQEGLEILIAAARCAITLRRDPARCRPSDIPIMVGDSAKLRTETGWCPARDFTTTLHDLLATARKEDS